jgi:hypothetical protein
MYSSGEDNKIFAAVNFVTQVFVQTLRFNVLVVPLILLLGSAEIEASSVGPSILIPVSILVSGI